VTPPGRSAAIIAVASSNVVKAVVTHQTHSRLSKTTARVVRCGKSVTRGKTAPARQRGTLRALIETWTCTALGNGRIGVLPD
jgi:hypothetical protein